MLVYFVENQWGGSNAPWHNGGSWVLGAREGQNPIAFDIVSSDGGTTFHGTMTYDGEGPIGFRAKNVTGNTYVVENQWGGSNAPWHPGGNMLIGGRDQKCVKLNIVSLDGGKCFSGEMTYQGEGPIGFKSEMTDYNAYLTENQWGGSSAPWHPGGICVIGCRGEQHVVSLDVKGNGINLKGAMTYEGEGPIGFSAQVRGDNAGDNFHVENQWGGSTAPWHDDGHWVIGTRGNKQPVVKWSFKSPDKGKTFEGEMTYRGEGPIGFKAILLSAVKALATA